MLLRRLLGARRLCATVASPAAEAPTGSALRWAVGGWAFFIAENALLSENRAHIISALGDDEKETKYHMLYGTISTAACVSIGYGYLRRARNAPPFMWAASAAPPLWRLAAGVLLQGIGFAGLAQGLPLLQSPVAMAAAEAGPAASAAPPSGWVVRCPFNFVDKDAAPAEDLGPGPHGAQRVTRHPGFWSFGFACLGAAATVASVPQAAWLCMPAVVALVGGGHADYRHRRGMGGSLPPETDALTSLLPFAAMLSGAQGEVSAAFAALADEVKASNAVAGFLFAGVRALRLVL